MARIQLYRLADRKDRYEVVIKHGDLPIGYDVTADVQRLIDEATKELREWREAVMTENERLNDENRSLRKQINVMGFAYDSLKRLYDSNRGDRPER
jgi:hypothetical protein